MSVKFEITMPLVPPEQAESVARRLYDVIGREAMSRGVIVTAVTAMTARCAYSVRADRPKNAVMLPGGVEVVPHAVKCYRPGCRRTKRGYLTIHSSHFGGGAFYNKRGHLLADLREKDFACREHGVNDGSAPFLIRDTP